MQPVFKHSGALVLGALAIGQIYLNDPATAAQVGSMKHIQAKCPALAPAPIEKPTYRDAIVLNDAYYRTLVIGWIAGGDASQRCGDR